MAKPAIEGGSIGNLLPAQVADIGQLTVIRHPYLSSRPRLGTIRGCRRELASLYAATKAGAVDPQVATRLTYILKTVIDALVVGEIEPRLAALENEGDGAASGAASNELDDGDDSEDTACPN